MHTAKVSVLTKSLVYRMSAFHPRHSKTHTLHSYHSHSSRLAKGHGIKCSSEPGMGDQGNSQVPRGIGYEALAISRMSPCRHKSLSFQTVPMASVIAAEIGVAAISTTEVVGTAEAQAANVVVDEGFGTSMDHVAKPDLPSARGSQETGCLALYAHDATYTGGSVTECSSPASTAALCSEGKPSSVSTSSLDCHGGDNDGRFPSENAFRLPSR